MNTQTEKQVRSILRELTDSMTEAANKHGKDNVNVCAFLKPHTLSSVTVNTNNGKYRFRLKLHMNGILYSVHLSSFNVHDFSASENQYKIMMREIYADHAEAIGLCVDNCKTWTPKTIAA